MQILDILNIVLPTFIIIAIGYIFGKITKTDFAPVANIALYVGAPAIVLTSLLNNPVVLLDAAKVWGASLVIMLGCGIVAYLVFTMLKQEHSGLYVPIIIMNTVNLPFPIAYFAYGTEGLTAASLFSIPVTLVLFSLGVYIVAGKQRKQNIREVFKIPVLYAAVLGLFLNFFRVDVPELAINSLDIIAKMGIPLVLLILGYNLSRVKITSLPITFLASFLRIGVGLMIGFLIVNLLGITGVFRSVVILESAMPAAATSVIIATKYRSEEGLVSSVVFITTITSLIVIPFLLNALS
ncbi:MAG TPA: AEC family transporter [Dehalococcoidia bacterium]|nr:AEC family transporter [Dehalococcoidia bacterium]